MNVFKSVELFRNTCIQLMRAQATESGVANFVQKAFDIISNNQYFKIIHWSVNGKEFMIKDIQQFEEVILPKYFRHRNINSFIRQLNMYGFHKSRKEPTKNIFSHPYFIKDHADLLTQVRRKIKEENETPRKPHQPEEEEEKNTIHDKPTALKEEPKISSSTSLAFKSSLCLEKEFNSPIKGLISRSFIMDLNPEICLKLRSNNILAYEQNDDEDDNLSIADEIAKERLRFNNRTQGIPIVPTSNFLEEFQF